MTLRLSLPVAQRIEEQTFHVELPELKGKRFVQLKRAPNEGSGAMERWVLSGLGSEFTAQADAAINPDGSAVTEQWRLEDKDFTLVIVQGANDLRGFFVGQHDFVRQCAVEVNIPTMPRNSEDHVVSTDRSWASYSEYTGVSRSSQCGRTFRLVQIGDWNLCVPHGIGVSTDPDAR